MTGVLSRAYPLLMNLPSQSQQMLETVLILDMIRSSISTLCCQTQGCIYKELHEDPAVTLQREINNSLLLQLYIASIPADLLCSSGGHTPLLYSLPKVHKFDIALCPMVSSPSYQLSYLSRILQLSPLIGSSSSHIC